VSTDDSASAEVFEHVHGFPPQVTVEVRGRVNLIGDHTDYADGFVLPALLRRGLQVSAARADRFSVHSRHMGETVTFGLDHSLQRHWSDYVAGSLIALRQSGVDVPPLALLVTSDLPLGVGLSSSAALEVGTIRAALALTVVTLDSLEIARIGQRAENEFCGVACGILDQMACTAGRPGHALALDCRSLGHEHVRIPDAFCFAVIDSGLTRQLNEGAYNERRLACEHAARHLGLPALRDAVLDDVRRLDGTLQRRARHVVTENARVHAAVEALRSCDPQRFGALMLESHRSLRDDFEVTVPGTDRLVEICCHAGAIGARQTGGGFGGALVALVDPPTCKDWWETVRAAAPRAQFVDAIP
jgi:galactokinase